MAEKANEWLAFGSPMVWVANPKKETVTVYRANRDPKVLQGDDLLLGDDVVPGFRVKVAEIFQS